MNLPRRRQKEKRAINTEQHKNRFVTWFPCCYINDKDNKNKQLALSIEQQY